MGTKWGVTGRMRARSRPCHPLADQAELLWRIGCDGVTLRFDRTLGGQRIPDELLYWIEATVEHLRTVRIDVAELQDLANVWERRRRDYRSFRDDDEWANVVVVDHLERPQPSRWWRWWHPSEPAPPRSCGNY